MNNKFDDLFHTYYEPLCGYVFRMVGDMDNAKEIVQNVYVVLWEKGDIDAPTAVLKSFLYTVAKRASIDFLRREHFISKYRQYILLEYASKENDDAAEIYSVKDLQQKIEKEISMFPPKCKEVFIMSRYKKLKYKEIADKLGISLKAVEANINRGIKILKSKNIFFFLY